MADETLILVVDDDVELNQAIAGEIRSLAGYVIESVYSVAGAEAVLSQTPIRVSAVLLDVLLPDGNGRDLCERVRAVHPQLPIIMMSGLAEEDSVVRGLERGADAYVIKPFAASEIIARLRHLLAG